MSDPKTPLTPEEQAQADAHIENCGVTPPTGTPSTNVDHEYNGGAPSATLVHGQFFNGVCPGDEQKFLDFFRPDATSGPSADEAKPAVPTPLETVQADMAAQYVEAERQERLAQYADMTSEQAQNARTRRINIDRVLAEEALQGQIDRTATRDKWIIRGGILAVFLLIFGLIYMVANPTPTVNGIPVDMINEAAANQLQLNDAANQLNFLGGGSLDPAVAEALRQ